MGLISENRIGAGIQAGGVQVFPVSRVTGWLPERESGGLIWNRPQAVLVREADGSERVLRVRDVTRERQLILLGIGLVGAFLLGFEPVRKVGRAWRTR